MHVEVPVAGQYSPARRTAEPRKNASQPASSNDMRSISDADSVPGCHPSERNTSTPTGGSPGQRAANAGSDERAENLRLNGHTSCLICPLSRYEIPLRGGQYRRGRNRPGANGVTEKSLATPCEPRAAGASGAPVGMATTVGRQARRRSGAGS